MECVVAMGSTEAGLSSEGEGELDRVVPPATATLRHELDSTSEDARPVR